MNAKTILTVLFIGHLSLFGQLNESFDFQLLDAPNLWTGDTDSFQLLNTRAHLNAPPNTSSSFISIPSNASFNGSWTFEVELDFNPSASNKLFVYLTSDNQNLKDSLNGYFVMIGNTTDEISLYRQSGFQQNEIIDGPDDFIDLNNVSILVSVERNFLGQWSLFADTLSAQNNLVFLGSTQDNSFQYSEYFGFRCQYTATRSDKFYFDNIIIDAIPFQDFFPPSIIDHNIETNKVVLELNETIITPSSANINLLDIYNQVSLLDSFFTQNNVLTIYSTIPFERNVPYQISLQQLTDTAGNTRDSSFLFSINNSYSSNEIQFSEFYTDPTPSYGLPKAEFIEIKNTLNEMVYLENFQLIDQSDTIPLPLDSLFPFEHLILCANANVDSFQIYGRVIGLSNFPSLNNSGDFFQLNDSYNNILDSITYKKEWFRNLTDLFGNYKSNGGFSLERVDSASNCSVQHNWYPCIDPLGGTPCSGTSVSFGDIETVPLVSKNAYILSHNSCVFNFNQEFDYAALQEDSSIILLLNEVPFLPDSFSRPNKTQLIIFSEHFNQSSNNQVSVQLKDCYNKPFTIEENIYTITPPLPGDLIINEILFNPAQGNFDFIEVFNRSNNAIALNDLIIYEKPFDADTIIDYVTMSDLWQLMPPKSYYVFTEDRNALLNRYLVENPENIVEVSLPNFPDDKAGVGIMSTDSVVLDEVFYEERWHLETQNNVEAFSLERISAEGPSNISSNWQTCATQYMATPTYKNSQSFEFEGSALLSVSTEVFSPNQDGYLDFIQISFIQNEANSFATAKIYDINGRPIKTLARNEILASENKWTWDGSDTNGQLAPIGIYIVRLEVLSESGSKKVYKEKLVLGNNL